MPKQDHSVIPSDHLGNGVYVTDQHSGFLLTANHHDPDQASDTIWLDVYTVKALERYIARWKEMHNVS